MATKTRGIGFSEWKPLGIAHATSIGRGTKSKPKNKHKRRSWKRYRGQGK